MKEIGAGLLRTRCSPADGRLHLIGQRAQGTGPFRNAITRTSRCMGFRQVSAKGERVLGTFQARLRDGRVILSWPVQNANFVVE